MNSTNTKKKKENNWEENLQNVNKWKWISEMPLFNVYLCSISLWLKSDSLTIELTSKYFYFEMEFRGGAQTHKFSL